MSDHQLSGAAMCSVALLLITSAAAARQPPAPERPVAIDGISSTYRSCDVVKFSLHNVLSHDVYVNVYVDNLENGEWKDAPCQYDLNDPRSRTAKLMLTQRNLVRGGATLAVAYDRCTDYAYCMVPKWGKQDVPWARLTLERADAHASSPVTQRVRVDAYPSVLPVTVPGTPAPDAIAVFSRPFTRAAPK